MASGRPGMNRMLIVIGAIVVIAILAVALPRFGRKPDVTRIGIMQIAEHPALDLSLIHI